MGNRCVKLGLLRGGASPGLPEWALHAVTGILVSERQGETRHTHRRGRGRVKTGVMGPQAKECQQLPEAGRHEEWLFPGASGGSIARLTCRFWTSGLKTVRASIANVLSHHLGANL